MKKCVICLLMSITLPAINIHLYFDDEIAETTGDHYMKIILSPDTSITMLLYFLFQSYPELEQKFPPGIFAFRVNRLRPYEHQLMQNDDRVDFYIFTPTNIN